MAMFALLALAGDLDVPVAQPLLGSYQAVSMITLESGLWPRLFFRRFAAWTVYL